MIKAVTTLLLALVASAGTLRAGSTVRSTIEADADTLALKAPLISPAFTGTISGENTAFTLSGIDGTFARWNTPGDPNADPLTQSYSSHDVNGPGERRNTVHGWGINTINGNGQLDPTRPSSTFVIEGHYRQGGVLGMEMHITGFDTNGVEHRSFTAFRPDDGGAGSATTLQTDELFFSNYAGVNRIWHDFPNNNIFWNGGLKLHQSTNNIGFLRQRNAAGNDYLNLPYINASNQLQIEQPIFSPTGNFAVKSSDITFDVGASLNSYRSDGSTVVSMTNMDGNTLRINRGGVADNVIVQPKANGYFGLQSAAYDRWLLFVYEAYGYVGIGGTNTPSRLTVNDGDVETDTAGRGLVLKSPDGTRYKITVANGGTLTVGSP